MALFSWFMVDGSKVEALSAGDATRALDTRSSPIMQGPFSHLSQPITQSLAAGLTSAGRSKGLRHELQNIPKELTITCAIESPNEMVGLMYAETNPMR